MADDKRPTYASDFIKGDWDKAVYLDNPHIDNLMTAFLGMGAEFWALKRRQLVVEQMLAQKKVVSLAAIEAYVPSPEVEKVWMAERDDFIQRVFSVFTRTTKQTAGTPPMTPEAARAAVKK